MPPVSGALAQEKSNQEPQTELNLHLGPAQLTRVLALMSSSRSGTSLMSSLLDAHPDILSIPDNYLWAFSDFWDDLGDLPAHDLAERFVSHYAIVFDARKAAQSPYLPPDFTGDDLGLTSLGENRDMVLTADTDIFCRSMQRLLPSSGTVTRRLFFQAVHIAYADAVGRKVGPDPIILFGLHIAHPHRVRKFLDDFPDALFLHMIRDPLQSTASMFRQYERMQEAPVGATMVGLANSLAGGLPVVPEATLCTRVVRLEDVHIQPKKTMLAICGWLQIAFHPILLQSTYNGLKFWNEKGQLQISGTSTQYIEQTYDAYLTDFDRLRIRSLCARRHSIFGYYRDSVLLRSAIIRYLLFPLLLWPLRMELIELRRAARHGQTRKGLHSYLALRLFLLKFLIDPPAHGVPLFGQSNW